MLDGSVILAAIIFCIGIVFFIFFCNDTIIQPIIRYMAERKLLNSVMDFEDIEHIQYLQNMIPSLAEEIIHEDYVKNKKAIKTHGYYRQDYLTAQEKEQVKIENIIYKNNMKEFKNYVSKSYNGKLLIKNLCDVVLEYVDKQSGIENNIIAYERKAGKWKR